MPAPNAFPWRIKPLLLLAAAIAASCGAPALSEEEAASVIEQSQEIRGLAKPIPFQSQGMAKALRQGVVDARANLDRRGQEAFERVRSIHTEDLGPFVSAQLKKGPFKPRHLAVLKADKTPTVSVSVTGIAEAREGSLRRVRFTWQYEGLPSLARRYLVGGGTGTADLRHYDTGWRVEELDIEFLDRLNQTAEERAEEAREDQQRAEQERAAQERTERLKQESRQQSRLLMRFSAYRSEWAKPEHVVSVEVWDTCIRVSKRLTRFSSRRPERSWRAADTGPGTANLWFGDIKDVSYTESRAYYGPAIMLRWMRQGHAQERGALRNSDKALMQRAHRTIQSALRDWRGKYGAAVNGR